MTPHVPPALSSVALWPLDSPDRAKTEGLGFTEAEAQAAQAAFLAWTRQLATQALDENEEFRPAEAGAAPSERSQVADPLASPPVGIHHLPDDSAQADHDLLPSEPVFLEVPALSEGLTLAQWLQAFAEESHWTRQPVPTFDAAVRQTPPEGWSSARRQPTRSLIQAVAAQVFATAPGAFTVVDRVPPAGKKLPKGPNPSLVQVLAAYPAGLLVVHPGYRYREWLDWTDWYLRLWRCSELVWPSTPVA